MKKQTQKEKKAIQKAKDIADIESNLDNLKKYLQDAVDSINKGEGSKTMPTLIQQGIIKEDGTLGPFSDKFMDIFKSIGE